MKRRRTGLPLHILGNYTGRIPANVQCELIDAHGYGRGLPSFWNHFNSVAYNEELDQIVISVRGFNEIRVIDHGTTSQEAAGHAGGKRGKGGDPLYRWGNPVAHTRRMNGDRLRRSTSEALSRGRHGQLRRRILFVN